MFTTISALSSFSPLTQCQMSQLLIKPRHHAQVQSNGEHTSLWDKTNPSTRVYSTSLKMKKDKKARRVAVDLGAAGLDSEDKEEGEEGEGGEGGEEDSGEDK
ncbi:hypothetical protein RSAG8_07197, partial [Rhizoctonia solani AG-8 WAC10335]